MKGKDQAYFNYIVYSNKAKKSNISYIMDTNMEFIPSINQLTNNLKINYDYSMGNFRLSDKFIYPALIY